MCTVQCWGKYFIRRIPNISEVTCCPNPRPLLDTDHKVHILYNSVWPLVRIGSPPPLSRKRVCPPLEPKGGIHTGLRVRGWGVPKFGRLEKTLSILSTLWYRQKYRQVYGLKSISFYCCKYIYDSVELTDFAVLVCEAAGQQVHLVLRPLRKGGLECVCRGGCNYNLLNKK